MRHLDVVRHRIVGASGYRFMCILQADAAGGPERIVAPMASGATAGVLTPGIVMEGVSHRILLRGLASVPVRLLGPVVGSAESVRADVTRGLDLLLFGI